MIVGQQAFAGRGRHQGAIQGFEQTLQFGSGAARTAARDHDGSCGAVQ
jgi:hypothetical protein